MSTSNEWWDIAIAEIERRAIESNGRVLIFDREKAGKIIRDHCPTPASIPGLTHWAMKDLELPTAPSSGKAEGVELVAGLTEIETWFHRRFSEGEFNKTLKDAIAQLRALTAAAAEREKEVERLALYHCNAARLLGIAFLNHDHAWIAREIERKLTEREAEVAAMRSVAKDYNARALNVEAERDQHAARVAVLENALRRLDLRFMSDNENIRTAALTPPPPPAVDGRRGEGAS